MKWQLCCRGRRSNCPQVAIEDRVIYIRDDDGHQIKVTLDQLQDIHLKVGEMVIQGAYSKRTPPNAPLGLVS